MALFQFPGPKVPVTLAEKLSKLWRDCTAENVLEQIEKANALMDAATPEEKKDWNVRGYLEGIAMKKNAFRK